MPVAEGGLNAFCWRQIFALDSVVVKNTKMFSSRGSFLTNAMHRHTETILSNCYSHMLHWESTADLHSSLMVK